MFKPILAVLMVATVLLSSIAVVDAQYGRVRGSAQAQLAPVAAVENEEEGTAEPARANKLRMHADIIKKDCQVKDSSECLQAVGGVGKSLDMMMDNIHRMSTKVHDQLERMDSAESDENLEVIDDRIAKLDALRDELKDAKTLDEVRDITKRFRDLWKDHRKALIDTRHAAWDGRAFAVLKKVERVVMNLEKLAARIKENDSQANKEVLEEIDLALAKIKAQVAVVKEAMETEDRAAVKTAVKELRQLLKEVKEHFKRLKHDNKEYDTEHDAAIRDSLVQDAQTTEPVPAVVA